MPNPAVAPAAGGADVNALNGEIASLLEALALERAKNEVLLEQCLKTEDALADKDIEGFADVIPNDDRAFWRGQLLENRTQPTLRSSPYRCARARTSVRLSLSDRKTAPSYALRCPPSTPGVKKRPPEPSPRPSGPRPT